MSTNTESEKAKEIIKDYRSSSNKDLMFVMDYIQKDFNFTKDMFRPIKSYNRFE